MYRVQPDASFTHNQLLSAIPDAHSDSDEAGDASKNVWFDGGAEGVGAWSEMAEADAGGVEAGTFKEVERWQQDGLEEGVDGSWEGGRQGGCRGACAHSEEHVGYVLIETASADTAVKVLQCMEGYEPTEVPNRTQHLHRYHSRRTRERRHWNGAQLKASLAHDSSFALAAAIRACSSRPQLIELLLPFLPSASPLIRDGATPQTMALDRLEGVGKAAMGEEGGILSEYDHGQISKSSAAVFDTLKGMQLDGEMCTLALRRLSALPVYPPVKPGESWHAKVRRFWREGPKMPPLVDPDWRPRVKASFQLQAVVAALLQRVLDLSKMTRTFALASVLAVLSRLRDTYLQLPGGFDWRYTREPFPGEPTRIRDKDEPHAHREYGWPGLTAHVWHQLATMRKGAVMECFLQIREEMQPRVDLRFRGARRGEYSQGHAEKRVERRSRDRYTFNPLVPGRLFEGDDVVAGSYMARTGSAAEYRVWLAHLRGVPEDQLPIRRAPVCDRVLMARAKAVDREINRREQRNYGTLMMQNYATTNRTLALQLARQDGMLKISEGVLGDMGEVRTPLEGFWMNDYTFPTPLTGPDPNDEIDKWRPAYDYTFGLKDPLFGRWRSYDRLPPHVDEEHELYRPLGLARTSVAYFQNMLELRRAGRPFLNCLGGVKVPQDNATVAALLAEVPGHAQQQEHERSLRESERGEGLEGLRQWRRERRAKRERERLEQKKGAAPEVSRDVDPDAWRQWMIERHARMCRKNFVSDKYMSGSEEEEGEENTLQSPSGTADNESLGGSDGRNETSRRRQQRRARKRWERDGVESPYFPGVIGKERGVEEWEREIHAEKLRALKRTVTASETLA